MWNVDFWKAYLQINLVLTMLAWVVMYWKVWRAQLAQARVRNRRNDAAFWTMLISLPVGLLLATPFMVGIVVQTISNFGAHAYELGPRDALETLHDLWC